MFNLVHLYFFYSYRYIVISIYVDFFIKPARFTTKSLDYINFLIVSGNLGLNTGFLRLKGLKYLLKRAQMGHRDVEGGKDKHLPIRAIISA